jgi:sensor histidine kinase YesM
MKQYDYLIDYFFSRQRWVAHVFFWIAVLLFYAIFFGRKNSNYDQTFFFVGLLMPVTAATTYFVNYYLVPQYLLKSRYAVFVLYFSYTLVLSLLLGIMISFFTFLIMAGMKVSNMSPASVDIFFLLTALLLIVFFSLAIKLLLHWRESRADYQKLMLDKAESELKFLKAQLNPHFLFNTLNNLYFLASEKSDKAPKAILALSEILDYVLRSGKTQLVPLHDEVKQVENYIALELLRYQERVEVSVNYSGNTHQYQIAPMILMTLVENAFKHGVMPSMQKAFIHVNVSSENNTISIYVSNSISIPNQGMGIGLENLKSQLEYLYKKNYTLNISSDKHEFKVQLTLPNEV